MEGFISFVKKFAGNDQSLGHHDIDYRKEKCNDEESFIITTVDECDTTYFTIDIVYGGMKIHNNTSFMEEIPKYLHDHMKDNTISEKFKADPEFDVFITKYELSMHPFQSRQKSSNK